MTHSIDDVLAIGASKLKGHVDTPLNDARILLAHVLNQTKVYLSAYGEETISQDQAARYGSLIADRSRGCPIAYLIQRASFWTFELTVTQDVLIPRPETECLVECVLSTLPKTHTHVAELGTGSGAIAIALAMERPNWQIEGIDISESALSIADNNARSFALKNLSFSLSNWCDALPSSQFDAVVANPPYISTVEWPIFEKGLKYEPFSALVSGTDGLDAIRHITVSAKRILKPRGYLFFEHGYQQGEAVRLCLAESGYCDINTVKDLAQHDRVSFGRLLG